MGDFAFYGVCYTFHMKDSRYEHLDYDEDGRIRGLWKIDAKKAKGIGTHDFWGKVEELIQTYTKLHPQEMVECLEYCARKREASYNDFGLAIPGGEEVNGSNMRLGIGIPNGLLIQILALDEEFLAPGGKLVKFQKMYPGFNTSKRY